MKANWIQELQHSVFRGVSMVFSLISAHAIYWFFSVLNGVDVFQPYVTYATSIGFALLGYFVTRGLAHRLMKGQKVVSYIVIGLLYVLVEVVCNYGEAAARYPDMQWIHLLQGWQLGVFSVLAPLVLSIVPLFNLSLAYIDVDLMIEKEGRASAPVSYGQGQKKGQGPQPLGMPGSGARPQPLPKQAPTPGSGSPTRVLQPQASYPPIPVPMPGPAASAPAAAASAGPFSGFFNGMTQRSRQG